MNLKQELKEISELNRDRTKERLFNSFKENIPDQLKSQASKGLFQLELGLVYYPIIREIKQWCFEHNLKFTTHKYIAQIIGEHYSISWKD